MMVLFMSWLLAAGGSGVATQGLTNPHPDKRESQQLEIRLTKPLAWKNHCLEVSIEFVNRSKAPLFLPDEEPVITSSVMDPTNTLGQGTGLAWLVASGLTNYITPNVIRLGPGKSLRAHYCVSDSVAVVKEFKLDSEIDGKLEGSRQTKRQVPVRGKLKISMRYFPALQNWEMTEAQREERIQTPPSKRTDADKSNGHLAVLELAIPCPDRAATADCDAPPPILEGEHGVTLPDPGR